MTPVVWTRQAIADLEAIHDFIARDSERYADIVIDRIMSAVDRVQEFPRSGRIVPEVRRQELRAVILGGYRIVY